MFISIFFILIIFCFPTYLGYVDNSIESNPLVTPTHIVPEIYLLPCYSKLRSIPSKLLGVLALIFNFFLLFILPYIQPSISINKCFRYNYSLFLPYFIVNYLFLGYLATNFVITPYIFLSLFLTLIISSSSSSSSLFLNSSSSSYRLIRLNIN